MTKVIGSALLIIGTSIGGGMLGLPVVTAAGGFYHSLGLFLIAWVTTVTAAYFILEVNLWLPEHSNLISMARLTLGPLGQIITWLCYLLLLYTLLSAYTAGGSDLLQSIFSLAHIQLAHWVNSLCFVIILGTIVFFGIRSVDLANRSLMSVKLLAYGLLVILIAPHVELAKLDVGQIPALRVAIMVVITSFGYGTVIPSLRTYFNSNVRALRIAIALGSLVSLLCYLLWDFVVQGTVPTYGSNGLIAMSQSGQAASLLTQALAQQLSSHISELSHLFTSICLTTSFLGVGLCLNDFLADGLQLKKLNTHSLLLPILTFLPPLLINIFYPGGFLLGLKYAGILCVVLLILLPSLMTLSGRYRKKISGPYRVWGGAPLIFIEIIIACVLLYFGIASVL